MPLHGFTPSLHQVTVLQGVLASVKRTPDKIAITENGDSLTYEQLRIAITAKDVQRHLATWPAARTKNLVELLAKAYASGTGFDESRIFLDPSQPALQPASQTATQPLSERVTVLRLLSAAVSHGVFSKDIVSGVPLPLTACNGVVAALLPLWLGGTLHLFDPGDISTIVEAVSTGRVNQLWLGEVELNALSMYSDAHESIQASAPRTIPPNTLNPPAASFRLAVCEGLPSDTVASTLLAWLGKNRVTAETGTEASGTLRRHPGLELQGEPCVGVIFSPNGMVASLTTTPASPAWRSALNAE
jgi:hypothetical protein